MAILKIPNLSVRWILAELSVVVFGILIAFQVDSWREDMSQREQERQYLTEMLIDLENDTISLNRSIAQRQNRLPAIRELIVLLTNPLTQQGREGKLLELESQALDGGIASFDANTVTFDKVQESGALAVVRDSQLYQQIIDYYAFYGISPELSQVEAWLGPWRQISLDLYGPLQFVQTFDFASQSDKYKLPTEELAERSIDVQARKENKVYMSFLGDMYQSQSYHEVRWQQVLDKNVTLQQLIGAYLNLN